MAYTIDFSIMSDAESFSLAVPPPGKISAETTTYGGAFNPSSADLLSGDGVFGSTTDDGGGATASSTSSISVWNRHSRVFNVGFWVQKLCEQQSSHCCGLVASGADTHRAQSPGYASPSLTISVTSTEQVQARILIGRQRVAAGIFGGVNQPHNWIGGGGYAGNAPSTSVMQVRGIARRTSTSSSRSPQMSVF